MQTLAHRDVAHMPRVGCSPFCS